MNSRIPRSYGLFAGLLMISFCLLLRSAGMYDIFGSGPVDDSLYYLQTARNMAAGLGSTFDGSNPTNGYHPLWFWACVLVFSLTGTTVPAGAAISLFLFLQCVLAGLVVERLFRLTALLTESLSWSIAAAVLCGTVLWQQLTNLLETPLYVFCLLSLIVHLLELLMDENATGKNWRMWRVILLAILLTLARLDALLYILVISGVLIFSRHGSWSRFGWMLSGISLLTLLIYAGLNHSQFGTAFPVSSQVKQFWSRQTLEAIPGQRRLLEKLKFIVTGGTLLSTFERRSLLLFALLGCGLAGLSWRRRHSLSPGEMIIGLLGLSLPLKLLLIWTVYHGNVADAYWYYTPDRIIHLILLAWLSMQGVARLNRNRPVAARILSFTGQALLGLWLILAVAVAAQQWQLQQDDEVRKRPLDMSTLLDVADFLHHPWFAGKRIAAWNSGILGYFSGHPVTNLDGLINSASWLQRIRQGTTGDVIRNYDVVAEIYTEHRMFLQALGFVEVDLHPWIPDPAPPFPTTGGELPYDLRIFIRADLLESFQQALARSEVTPK